MGICSQVKQTELSPQLREKAILIFQRIDHNKRGVIDKQTTQQFWKSNFAKLNTEALFKAVDFDESGDITLQEWLAFWDIVKTMGYNEQEIAMELDELMEGKAWVQFKDVDKYIKKDKGRRRSQIQTIIQMEHQKTTQRIHKSKTQEY